MAESLQPLLRLLQLASPTLPVGAYAYSGGMETAVEQAWVSDRVSGAAWLRGVLRRVLGQVDAPIFFRLYRAWQTTDGVALTHWSAYLLASREGKELQDEDVQLASALRRVLTSLNLEDGLGEIGDIRAPRHLPYATLFAYTAHRMAIDASSACAALLWSWLENQVLCAVKLIPLGQSDGQRLLFDLSTDIDDIVQRAESMADDEIGATAPALAIATAWHETQYSRLFRS